MTTVPPVQAVYRSRPNDKFWHFCQNCSEWSAEGYAEKMSPDCPPPDGYCPECSRHLKEGRCVGWSDPADSRKISWRRNSPDFGADRIPRSGPVRPSPAGKVCRPKETQRFARGGVEIGLKDLQYQKRIRRKILGGFSGRCCMRSAIGAVFRCCSISARRRSRLQICSRIALMSSFINASSPGSCFIGVPPYRYST
jgi:hypothetical protein